MARRANAKPIYQAADLFRGHCFTTGQCLLWPDQKAWTPATLRQLWDAIIGHPDEGDRTFEKKLRDQLAPLPDEAHRVAAEAMGFYYLFPSKVGAETKAAKVYEVISWRLRNRPSNLGVLDQAFAAGGVGGAGPYYSFGKPWQFAYILKFAELALDSHNPLDDPQSCTEIADRALSEVPRAGEARNILLHLLFPDNFERVASRAQKRKIVKAFGDLAEGAQDTDLALANIRKALAAKHGRSDIDFYDREIEAQWRGDGGEDDIRESLEAILAGYVEAKNESFGRDSDMYQLFRHVETAFARCEPVQSRPNLRVKASPGQGNWAAVPWIAFLDVRETTSTQKGVYCVYLFREDMSGVYLTFNQGVTELTRKHGRPAVLPSKLGHSLIEREVDA